MVNGKNDSTPTDCAFATEVTLCRKIGEFIELYSRLARTCTKRTYVVACTYHDTDRYPIKFHIDIQVY